MATVPVDKRNHLYAWVALQHFHQKRKYTGEPYFNHLVAVAEMADGKCLFGYEIGLCHDLLEDTECTKFELEEALFRFKYDDHEVAHISNCVEDLTDVYTHDAFPQLNRATRKSEEAKRLHNINPNAQTVKYCDLINNTESIVQHDKGFAVKYLEEKRNILSGMNKGNPEMFLKCHKLLKKASKQLSELEE